MDAVILSAGRGERLRPLTNNMPKPLMEIEGKPILEHIISDLSNNGFRNIYFIVGYLKEQIIDFINQIKDTYNINPIFIFQEKQLGTAHAISLLPKEISSNFLVLAGDSIVYNIPYKEIMQLNSPLYLIKKTNEYKQKSIVEIKDKKIANIYYNNDKDFENSVFTDISVILLPKEAIYYASRIDYNSEIYLSEVVNKMIKDGINFNYLEFKGKIKHITSLEDLKN